MSTKYHKIQTLYKREEAKPCNIILGDYTCSEFAYLATNKWIWTEKIDGTNIRVIWDGVRVRFAGKTDTAQIPATLVDYLRIAFPEDKMIETFPEFVPNEETPNITLYGEGYGSGIHKGGVYLRDAVGFILFDVKIGPWWLLRPNKQDIAKKLEIPIVPIIFTGTILDAVSMVRLGFKSKIAIDKEYFAEGLVGAPYVEMFNRKGERIITKIKHKDFRFLNTRG